MKDEKSKPLTRCLFRCIWCLLAALPVLAGCADPDLRTAIGVGNEYMAAVGSADLDAAMECYDDSGPYGHENAERYRATLAERLDAWSEMESFRLTATSQADVPTGTTWVLGYACKMRNGTTLSFYLRLIKWKGSTEPRVIEPMLRRSSVAVV